MDKYRCAYIITIAILLLAFFASCPRPVVDTVTVTSTVTRVDTVRVRDTVYFPQPFKVIETAPPGHIDTAAVIKDYFSEKHYNIDYADSLIKATTQIKLLSNAIESIVLDYDILQKHTFTTIRNTRKPKFVLALGGSLSYSVPQNRPGMELNATLRFKSHNILIGYDILNGSPRLGWQYDIITTKK
ncbi:hypothetical protein LJC68_07195 [Bacteroidales bacterium OttesenSCG-928-B11]|nr:hypothetical protein [Bacteroidales bacterium OttesenSCG-928-C03]MDL2312644.1 hypothetical protein [Bacteroidales bacterium OttesenSCG-928-B11]MDL2326115.1 hypothetical protein [Bacteroidales bacterium OttesenSCG-928-A14]